MSQQNSKEPLVSMAKLILDGKTIEVCNAIRRGLITSGGAAEVTVLLAKSGRIDETAAMFRTYVNAHNDGILFYEDGWKAVIVKIAEVDKTLARGLLELASRKPERVPPLFSDLEKQRLERFISQLIQKSTKGG